MSEENISQKCRLKNRYEIRNYLFCRNKSK